ncbi:MAG: hypothetical protein M1283_06275 [Gammaproteobacteria bacterium]|nr:hypothetical protein [Gammaproteobacteria bacterium]
MNQEQKKITKVEELSHFPFKSFQEFKKAIMEGVAQPGVDRSVALNWAQSGIYAPGVLRAQTVFLMLLPYIAVLGFIVWALVSKNWLMLLALPVLLIAFFIFHPSMAIFGIIRSGFIWLSFVGLVYAFMTSKPGLLALCITLVVIWYALRTIYKKAVGYLTKAVSEHEDLLCILWQGKDLNIMFFNGNRFWVDWKTENGQSVFYDEE